MVCCKAATSCSKDLCTLIAPFAAAINPFLERVERSGAILAANEAMGVQKSVECEVAALQQTMLSMRNQSQINSSAISGYQEGALWANHWLKRKIGRAHV